MAQKIIILPGNGNSNIETDHWYAWVRDQLKALGLEVIAQNMPDPEIAHKDIWLPHLKNHLHADENTIIVGHSSGGVAALRYLETNQLLGAVIAGVNHTDLGYPEEKASGYYDAPWQWDKIKEKAKWIVQFASTDDPFIPVEEPRLIHEKLDTEYHEFTNRGHFMSPQNTTFPEIIEIIKQKLTPQPTSTNLTRI
jgi:hypothetical protein